MEFVTGSCKVMHGCDKGCSRGDVLVPILCGYCGHDISAHEILGMVKDGILIPLGAPSAAPVPLSLKETADAERKRIFKTKPRASVGAKRKITTEEDEPRRMSGGRSTASSTSAAAQPNVIAKLIAMKREDPIPLTDFDHTELTVDYFIDFPLTTAAKLTHTLKMTSTMGELFAKKFYL